MNPRYILGRLDDFTRSNVSTKSSEFLDSKKVYLFTLTFHSDGTIMYTLPGNNEGIDGKWWFYESSIKKVEVDENGQPFLEGIFG